jgi:hypothetical protein
MTRVLERMRRLLNRWGRPTRRPAGRYRPRLEALEVRCTPAVQTYVVTTTAYTTDISHLRFNSQGHAFNSNNAPVSLFEAIRAIDSGTYPGASEIDFNLPGSGVQVFAMPAGTTDPRQVISQDQTTINGYTQPGSRVNTLSGAGDNAVVPIELAFRLDLNSANNTVKGLSLRGIDLGAGGGNQIDGNLLGVNPFGGTMSSTGEGIAVGSMPNGALGSNNNHIGSQDLGDRNVIADHTGARGYGVGIYAGSTGNFVWDNLVFGNQLAGVYFDASATTGNSIAANIIIFNKAYGIRADGGTGNAFYGNAIGDNATAGPPPTGGGILLAPGANGGLAAPVLDSWTATTITGHLPGGTPSASYIVQFYVNAAPDQAGLYEGPRFLTQATVTPDAQGNFTASVTQPTTGGVTAIVIDGQGNTSAFSAAGDFALTATAGPTLHFAEGLPGSRFLLGTIRDGNPVTHLSRLQATIDWGDGSAPAVVTSTASADGQIVAGTGGTYLVRGNHKYAEDGAYNVQVVVEDLDTTSTASFTAVAHVAEADLAGQPVPIAAVEGTPFSGSVATFTDPDGTDGAGAFSATINWGNGQTSGGVVVQDSPGHFHVEGQFIFPEESAGRTVTTTITEVGLDPAATIHVTSRAVVADAALHVSPSAPLDRTEGVRFTDALATFTDDDPGAVAGDFTATITWGDGTAVVLTSVASPAGQIVAGPGGTFTIRGTHTYVEENATGYAVGVTVRDAGGAHDGGGTTIQIDNAPLAGTPVTIAPVEGHSFSGVIARFTDPDVFAVARDYSATIDWGDGTITTASAAAGTLVRSGAGFAVIGTHTYQDETSWAVNVVVTDEGGPPLFIASTANIADAALTLTPRPVAPVEGAAFTGVLGTFTDGNPGAPAADFTVTINWGDGSPLTTGNATDGTVTVLGRTFVIHGTHTYAEEGTYAVLVTVVDEGGAQVTRTLTATVTDAPLSPRAVTFTPTMGVAFSGTVASFTDPGTDGMVADYTATITWGDGHVTTASGAGGTITSELVGGQLVFHVLGTNTYARRGTFAVRVSVKDHGGAVTTVSSSAVVG